MSTPAVALIRQKYNPAGGAERFVERALGALAGRGAAITLITRHWPASAGQKVVELSPWYAGRTLRDWSFARAVQRHLRLTRYDLVQSHERLPWCDIYRAGDGVHREWLAQRARTMGPVRRLAQAFSPHHRYVLRAERRMFGDRGVESVICISEMGRAELRHHYQVADERIEVIYPGVDTEKFHPRLALEHRGPVRDALRIPADALVLAYAGSGFERKGVGPALRAVALSGIDCHFLLLGHDKHASRYHALARTLGLESRAHFLGVKDDVRPWLAAADIFIMPSLYEPFGNANMEALALGLPVITSSKSGAAELVRDAAAGRVCDALDFAAQARAIQELNTPSTRQAAGAAARTVAESHSLERMVEKLTALYERILARRRNGSDAPRFMGRR